jgi:hypothetical protein
MAGPSWENNQLTPYLREFNLVSGTTRGSNVPPSPWWAQLPAMYAAANNFAGLSTAPNTESTPAADTTAGNVVADAGFGGAQQ